jgi:hypothetical protein
MLAIGGYVTWLLTVVADGDEAGSGHSSDMRHHTRSRENSDHARRSRRRVGASHDNRADNTFIAPTSRRPSLIVVFIFAPLFSFLFPSLDPFQHRSLRCHFLDYRQHKPEPARALLAHSVCRRR